MRAHDPDEDEIPLFDDLEPIDEDPRGFLARLVGGEGGVVLHPHEGPRRCPHPRDIERFLDPPDVGLEEGRLAAGDLIQVAARLGVVARVEAVRGLVDPPDVDVGREGVVEAAAQRVRRQVGIQVEVGDLRERVHAGVCPPGAVELELTAASHVAHGPIDLSRDRPRVLLDLPAAVTRPRVFDDELESGH